MKYTLKVLASAIITMSPVFSVIAFSIYGGKNEVFDAICFLTFGATCYSLACLQSYIRHN